MRYYKHKPYYIKFHDHCISDNECERITCEVVGWIEKIDRKFITLTFWRTMSACGDKRIERNNNEFIQIIRSTILESKQLEV